MVKWPPTRGWKGYFESHGTNYSSGCLVVVSSMIFQAIGEVRKKVAGVKFRSIAARAGPFDNLRVVSLWSDHLRYKPSRTKCHDESKFKWKHNQNEWIFLWLGFMTPRNFLEYKEVTLVMPSPRPHRIPLFFRSYGQLFCVWPPLRRASERCLAKWDWCRPLQCLEFSILFVPQANSPVLFGIFCGGF